jgi:hypothetical protein
MTNDTSPVYATNPDAYLSKLREEMAGPVKFIQLPDGTVAYGFRCWPNEHEQAILDAMLHGLAESNDYKRDVEIYGVLVNRDAVPGEYNEWSEAWRVSDRKLAAAAPLKELVLTLFSRRRAASAAEACRLWQSR